MFQNNQYFFCFNYRTKTECVNVEKVGDKTYITVHFLELRFEIYEHKNRECGHGDQLR
jgi:hypothetical protein